MANELVNDKQPFWKTTTGMVIKIAGFLSAATVIFSFVVKMVVYVKESDIRNSEEKISAIIKSYYARDDADDYPGIASLFDPIVDE
jgi:hypothetical protein